MNTTFMLAEDLLALSAQPPTPTPESILDGFDIDTNPDNAPFAEGGEVLAGDVFGILFWVSLISFGYYLVRMVTSNSTEGQNKYLKRGLVAVIILVISAKPEIPIDFITDAVERYVRN